MTLHNQSAIAGTIGLTRSIFNRWGEFRYLSEDLTECCAILKIRTGLEFVIDPELLRATHTKWQQDCESWLDHLLPEGTVELSHLKKAAILLEGMCEFVPIKVSGEGYQDASPEPLPSIQDTEARPQLPTVLGRDQIRKFKDGGCHFVAWLILYHVCEFFERHRDDRLDAYEPRITEDFETDAVSGLLSGKVSAQSLHLIFKALFLRD
jgi:hypothetical protein